MSPVAPCTEAVGGPAVPSRLGPVRAATVAVAVLGSAILPVILIATLAARIADDIPLGSKKLGFAVAVFWAAAALSAPAAGRLVDRVGGGTGVHAAGAVSALGSLGIAILADGYAALVALLALCGVGSALAAPGMSALVSRQMDPGRRGTVIGFQQSGPPVATLVAAVALPLVAEPLGWRACFAIAAALAVVAAASVPGAECDLPHRASTGQTAGLLPLALGGGLAAAAASAAVAFLVPFALDEGLGTTGSAAVLAGASACAVAARIALGIRADRTGADRFVPMGVLLVAGASGFVLLATAATWAIVVGSLLAIGAGWGWAGLLILAAIERRPDAPGAAVGSAVSGLFAGAVLGPLVAGLLSDVSPRAVWLACAAASLAAAALLLGERGAPELSGRSAPRRRASRRAAARTP